MSLPPSRKPPAEGEAESILVVEDDEPIRLALRELLECEGYDVVLAADGKQALEFVTDHVPALVLTDVQMPLLDGAELCEKLRGARHTKHVPIVVLTAARRVEGVERYADAVVRKPFDIDALLAVIAQFIRPTVPPRPSLILTTDRSRAAQSEHALVLYVTRGSASCARAEHTVRSILESELPSGALPMLEVVDVLQDPHRAERDRVAMTPTLARDVGNRRELFLGDLTDLALLRAFLVRRDRPGAG